MEASEEWADLFKDLVAARHKVKQPSKSADNPYFNSKYVNLEGVAQAIDEACKDTGITYLQEVTSTAQPVMGVKVTTIIIHSSGQWLKLDPLTVPTGGKNTAQAMGSAETYARRYSLAAAFGVTSDVDDDGNEASNIPPQNGYQQGYQQPPQYQQPQQAPQPQPQPQPRPQQSVNSPELNQLLTVYRKLGIKITSQAAKTYYDRAARKVGIDKEGQTPTDEQAVSMAKQLNIDLMEIEDSERKGSKKA